VAEDRKRSKRMENVGMAQGSLVTYLQILQRSKLYKFCKGAKFVKFARLFYEQILQDGFKEKRKKKGQYTHIIPLDILAAA
jgi:hypothetical protein